MEEVLTQAQADQIQATSTELQHMTEVAQQVSRESAMQSIEAAQKAMEEVQKALMTANQAFQEAQEVQRTARQSSMTANLAGEASVQAKAIAEQAKTAAAAAQATADEAVKAATANAEALESVSSNAEAALVAANDAAGEARKAVFQAQQGAVAAATGLVAKKTKVAKAQVPIEPKSEFPGSKKTRRWSHSSSKKEHAKKTSEELEKGRAQGWTKPVKKDQPGVVATPPKVNQKSDEKKGDYHLRSLQSHLKWVKTVQKQEDAEEAYKKAEAKRVKEAEKRHSGVVSAAVGHAAEEKEKAAIAAEDAKHRAADEKQRS